MRWLSLTGWSAYSDHGLPYETAPTRDARASAALRCQDKYQTAALGSRRASMLRGERSALEVRLQYVVCGRLCAEVPVGACEQGIAYGKRHRPH